MKSILLCLLLLPLGLYAQVVRIDSLPPQGFLLDKGWTWHAGDNPDFAKADFDDSKWESIDPTKDIMDLPQLDKESGRIGWFRLRFIINKSLTPQLAMQIRQSGASELYLNGQLIHNFGYISKTSKEIEAFTPNNSPVTLPVLIDSEQVLAIRYALQPGIRYGQHFGPNNPGLTIVLNKTDATIASYRQSILNERGGALFAGAFGIFTILFMAFFFFFPTRKDALYFALFCLALVITWSTFYYVNLPIKMQDLFFWKNFVLVMQAIGYILLLQSVYTILVQKRGWIFRVLVGLDAVAIYCGIYVYPWGWNLFGFGLTNFVNLDATRVAFLAARRGQRGARIIVIGGIFYMIAWFIFCFQFLNIFPSLLDIDFFNISIFSIPVSYAIFFGYDFSVTNRMLKQKLEENETLSAEKQQILAAQNELLEKQVEARTAELKASQAQLIQKEKLASLGELTAGIAHEIQNPLNFVNNFSELSVELIEEAPRPPMGANENWLPQEAPIGGWGPFFDDLTQNLEKINHHGKRAASIVKGMLEHSRTATGERQLTDMNSLADEYLRLAYHGFRAKNSSFSCDYELIAEENLPNIEGPARNRRVLLNLFLNNAFYAVNERAKQEDSNYHPKVTVSTKELPLLKGGGRGEVEIRVQDNGTGIPSAILPKIFQPFFTTKPTGEGTGLGLSLSYDIVTKGHGGTLEVESVEGEGTTFIVTLPL
ncbi:MAG: ATP-binding protein [Spirosomataceae bacterium]